MRPPPPGGTGRPRRTRRLALMLAAPLAVGLVLLVVLLTVTSGAGLQRWPEGTTHGPWRSVFDGGGFTGSRGDVVVLEPRRSLHPSETHAGLVVSVSSYGDIDYRLQARTTEQLRRPTPNAWEAAWVLWHYTDPQHFYYLALKPTGWELGKEDPAYPGSQRFLATGLPVNPIGPWHDVEIRQTGATLTVQVDGKPLATVTDDERPYLSGNLGLYTEDAHAEFRHFSVQALGPTGSPQ